MKDANKNQAEANGMNSAESLRCKKANATPVETSESATSQNMNPTTANEIKRAGAEYPESVEQVIARLMSLNSKPQQCEMPQFVFTVEEAAALLKVTPKTIYRLVDRGLLKASKALRHLRITRTSMDTFLAETSGETIARKNGRTTKAGTRPQNLINHLDLGSWLASQSIAASEPRELGNETNITRRTALNNKGAFSTVSQTDNM